MAGVPPPSPIARPPQLSLLLSTLQQKYAFGEDKYGGFVSLADTAVRELRQTCMFSIEMSSLVDKSRHSLSDPNVKSHELDKNSSLLLVFMFYAAMQVSGTASFSATQLANETMTLYELDKFCRDFNIIPNMLSKSEIKAVWASFASAYSLKYRTTLTAMTFEDFKDLFVRMALFSYNKRGMKRMIEAVAGRFPPPEELVRFFCSYCHLDDYGKVKHIIRTVGAQTQGAINFRSKNESNVRARQEQIIDLRAKAVMRQAMLEARAQEEEFNKRKEENKKREAALRKAHEESLIHGPGGGGGGGGGKMGRAGEDDKVLIAKPKHKLTPMEKLRRAAEQQAFDESPLPGPILDLIVSPAKRASRAARAAAAAAAAATDGSGGGGGGGRSLSPSPTRDGAGTLSHTFSQATITGGGQDTGLPPPRPGPSSSSSSSSSDPAVAAAAAGGDSDDDDEEEEQFRHEDDMLAGYHAKLVDELECYSYNEPGQEPLEGTASGGPFLDMGNVAPRSVCTITIRTINLLPEDVRIDVLARGFNATNDTNVKTKTKPIVPGMSRSHVVSFTTTDTLGAQVGLVTFLGFSERLQCRCEVVCPVFYRVDPTVRPRSLLTLRTLPDAKARFLGQWAREELRVSFEKQRTDGIFAPAAAAAAGPGARPGTGPGSGAGRRPQSGSRGGKRRGPSPERRAVSEGRGVPRMPQLRSPLSGAAAAQAQNKARPTTAAM